MIYERTMPMWANATWLTIAGVVIPSILALVLYFKGRRVKRLCYYILSTNVVSDSLNKIPSLNITYDGESIPNITVSRIIVWNSGNETVKGGDVPLADPISICPLDEVAILDWEVVYSKKENSVVPMRTLAEITEDETIILNSQPVNIRFDYLDPKDGVIIQILHTGRSNSDILVAGSIMGGGKIACGRANDDLSRLFKNALLSGIVVFVTVVAMIFLGQPHGLMTHSVIQTTILVALASALLFCDYVVIRALLDQMSYRKLPVRFLDLHKPDFG